MRVASYWAKINTCPYAITENSCFTAQINGYTHIKASCYSCSIFFGFCYAKVSLTSVVPNITVVHFLPVRHTEQNTINHRVGPSYSFACVFYHGSILIHIYSTHVNNSAVIIFSITDIIIVYNICCNFSVIARMSPSDIDINIPGAMSCIEHHLFITRLV